MIYNSEFHQIVRCENDVEKKMGPVDWGQEALDRWILAPGQGGQGTRPAPGGDCPSKAG